MARAASWRGTSSDTMVFVRFFLIGFLLGSARRRGGFIWSRVDLHSCIDVPSQALIVCAELQRSYAIILAGGDVIIIVVSSLDVFLLFNTRKDVCAIGTYLIFLPSSNDIIYFLFKNNTHIFPSIKQ